MHQFKVVTNRFHRRPKNEYLAGKKLHRLALTRSADFEKAFRKAVTKLPRKLAQITIDIKMDRLPILLSFSDR